MNNGNARLIVGFFALLALFGLYAGASVLIKGQGSLGSTNAVPWNIFVSDYVFFVVTSTGVCFVSAYGHVFGAEKYNLIAPRAVYTSLILLVVGGLGIMADIGRPWLIYYMLVSPNLTSPMFWMAVLYGFYGLFLVMELVYLRQGNHAKVRTASTLAALSALVAHSMLGALFGMVQAKPLWFGPYLPIYFILSALISGLAVLVVLSVITYKVAGKRLGADIELLLKDMGKLLLYTLGAGIFFVAWKTIAGVYSGKEDIYLLTKGSFSLAYWGVEIGVGLVLPFLMLLPAVNRTLPMIAASSTLVLVGLFVARYNLVIAGQIIPPWESLGLAAYTVTLTEALYTLGLFGFFGVLYIAGLKYLGLEDGAHEETLSAGKGVSA